MRRPHATTISRTLAGVSYGQLQQALLCWMAGMAPASGVDAAVDGKWAKQSTDGSGNPLAMVSVLAHDLKLCLAQWPLAGAAVRAPDLAGAVGRFV